MLSAQKGSNTMPENSSQSLANHTRFDPPFHFFVLSVLGITPLLAIWRFIQYPTFESAWLTLVAVALLVLAFKTRLYALKAQDRVIRLEERLRLASLLQEPLRSQAAELAEGQLIALRFASDRELPDLVEKTLSGKLSKAEIKKAITSWRADDFRI